MNSYRGLPRLTQVVTAVSKQSRYPAACALLFAALSLPAFGQSSFGLVGGIARNSSTGMPVAKAQIVAHNLEKGTDRQTVSDADGIFTFTNLEPGPYEVAATKDGFEKSSAQVEVAARRVARVELPLESLADTRRRGEALGNLPLSDREQQLLDRVDQLEQRLAAMEAAGTASPEAAKAGTQPPVQEAALTPNAALPPAAPAPPLPAPAPKPQAAEAAPAQVPAATTPAPVDLITPFADHDWTWLNGNSRQHEYPLDTKYFSPEFRADTFYVEDFNQPIDHTMGGSSEIFRNNEVQLEDLSIGGDFHDGQMRGRVLLLDGMFAATTVRNDASPAVGQWDVRAAYKYISEAYGGYHFNVNHGLNVDAGIFVSYVGLFSYHNFDNWAYQPSYVSSNTPWFFNGVRIQWFPTHHLKIEPWFINGWQSYNRYNGHPGLGGQLKWTPKAWLNVIANQYGVGNDNIGLPNRGRYHTDDSVEVKYYDSPKSGNGIDKMGFTFTGDLGCETGDGVTCHGSKQPYNPVTGTGGPKQAFLGWMAYNRWWWHKDVWAFTLGGGQMNNPGRYLTLVLPVNGADAISGTPYFPAYPGAPMKAYDGTATLDWMPNDFTTFRWEFGYRHSNVPYFSGRGGSTPPGGNNGSPADFVCATGASSGATDLATAELNCGGGKSSVWFPDLREGQATLSMMIMVKL
ncbi:MAG TPA: TonB-dependent receptor [Bryobacteraceae bacterium]|jgi:hypothetical protein